MEKADEEQEVDATVELLAPAGWSKKFTPRKAKSFARKKIVFVSPAGDEISNKKQLEQYLRSHPGCPSSSEFDWGYGDTPRRSARISQKAKAMEDPENESPRKRQKSSSPKEGTKQKKDDVHSEEDNAEAHDSEKTDAKEKCEETAEGNAELDLITKPTKEEEADEKETDKDSADIPDGDQGEVQEKTVPKESSQDIPAPSLQVQPRMW